MSWPLHCTRSTWWQNNSVLKASVDRLPCGRVTRQIHCDPSIQVCKRQQGWIVCVRCLEQVVFMPLIFRALYMLQMCFQQRMLPALFQSGLRYERYPHKMPEKLWKCEHPGKSAPNGGMFTPSCRGSLLVPAASSHFHRPCCSLYTIYNFSFSCCFSLLSTASR